jgi:hypothetical protein
MANSASSTKVVTGVVRLSYFHGFQPFTNNADQDAQYSTVILIPKSDKKTLKAIRAAQQAALEAGKNSKFGGKIPSNWGDTLRDGDEEADLEKSPEYKGHMFMSVKSKTKPGIVDRDLNEILDSTEVYSGAYAKVSINAFPYSNSGNKGVSFGLNHVMKWRDGDFLGGRSSADDDFKGHTDGDDGDEDDDVI